jgi:protein tyrosine phosphatase (PTP) superfamily phosphohydrolase (DUF442 family)
MDVRAPRPARFSLVPLFISLISIAAPRMAGAITITADQAGITNFGQINENYFRGAQPNQEGFHRLARLGVKTIVDLQEKGKEEEPGWVQSAGMKYFCIPLSGNHPATDAQTAQFLQLVNDPANWPVYVHCAAGRHRTGEMTGIYRITHDTWTADQAYQEMQKYGYYSFPFHGSLKTYVYAYYDTYHRASSAKVAVTTPADSLKVAVARPAAAPTAVPAAATP